MSRSRYAQVALTYTRPFPLRVWAVATAAFLAWIFSLHEANYQVQCTMVLLGVTLAGWIGPMVTAHAKEQLADWRARLMPAFVAPHLLIAALFFIVSVIGMTCLVTFRLHQLPTVAGWPTMEVSQTGLLAVVLMASTMLVVMSHTQSPPLIFSVIPAVALAVSVGRPLMVRIISGELPALANAIIALSVATLAGVWWRLGVMQEEMFEFWRTESFNNLRVRVAMTGDRYYRRAAAGETGWLAEHARGAHRLDALTNIFAAPFWQRVRHWRLVIGHGKVSWPLSLLVAAFFLGLFLIFGDGTRDTEVGLLLVLPTVISLTGPVMGTGLIWPQRWFTLPLESLRPASSRATFFREHGTAMALETANLWIWFTIGAFAVPLVFRPHLILTSQMASVLVLLAASQVWLFGASVWLLRLRLNWLVNFLAIIVIVGAAGNLLAIQVGKDLRTPSPLAAPIVFAAGLLAVADAYRRWLKTDLD